MAKRGKNASVLVDQYDLSRFLNSASPSATAEVYDGTPFQAPGGDKVFVPGFVDGKLSLEGFFESDDVDEAAVDDVLNAALGRETKQVITVSPEGAATLGNRCYLVDADLTSYKVSVPAQGLIMSSAEIQSSSGLGGGKLLHPLTEETADGNGASVDNAVATTKGGAGHLHVTAFGDDTDSLDVKIQHSTNNSTWFDKIVFAQATGETAERKEVTGTINRYTRAVRDVAGSDPAVTFAVGISRFK